MFDLTQWYSTAKTSAKFRKFNYTLLRDGVSERYTRTLYPGFIVAFLFVQFVQILYLPMVPDTLRQIMYCCTMCFSLRELCERIG